MVRVKDFKYTVRRTGTRITGEAQYLWHVSYKDQDFDFGHRFTTKRQAQEWVSAIVRNYKEGRRNVRL